MSSPATVTVSLSEWKKMQDSLMYLQGNLSNMQSWESSVKSSTITLNSGVNLNSGDTAWMLTSTALVLMMTLPGVALFYGGMCQAKNVLSTVMQSYSIACMITIMWFMFSYSLCFSTGSPVIGNAQRFWLIGTEDTGNQQSPMRLGPLTAHALLPGVPESVYMTYQLTFAIITGVLVCGSFAERMKFSSMLIFIFIWHILVYCPVCHSEWAVDGFLQLKGDLDFAGGNVVHISSGFSGLAASIVLGPRIGWGVLQMKPHNIVYSVIGGALLWVGWFGFNAGSAGAANPQAGYALMVTHISSASGGFIWMCLEYFHRGKASVIGIVSGTVTGLVLITPGSGYVDHTAAFFTALIGTPLVYVGLQFKHQLGYDDALDAFGVHGVGGVLGGILTGFFANDYISGSPTKKGVFYGRGIQLGYQILGIIIVAGWSFFASFVILFILRATIGLRVNERTEADGLDISEHGESMLEGGEYSEHGKPYVPGPQQPAGLAPGAAQEPQLSARAAPPPAANKVAPLEVVSNCD